MHHESKENTARYPKYFESYEKEVQPKIQSDIKDKCRSTIVRREVDVPFCTSFRTLVDRDFKNVLRNPLLIKMRVVQTIFVAVYGGGLYCKFSGEYTSQINWYALIGFFFFLTINMMMMALAPVGLVFPSERNVFLKEEGAKLYTVTSYFMSRNIIEIPYSIVFPLLQALIMYWFVGLSSTAAQFFTFYLVCYLISFAGMSMGLMLGSMVTDEKAISTLMPIVILPFFLFSGLFKNEGNYPDWIGWIQYISPIKYAFAAYL
jgi:ATP-binding cassette, subfamily G (WHITE), eye pigment precursor transporter